MGIRRAPKGAFLILVAAALTLLGAMASTAGGTGTAVLQTRSPLAKPSARTAAVPAGEQIRFEIGMKLNDPQGAAELAEAVSEPSSAQFHHYLTSAQWDKRFSPSRASVAAVTEWLASQGLTVTGVTPDRLSIQAQGSAASIERAFDVSLGEYSENGHELRLASGSLVVPSGIAAAVSGVLGVNQFVATHPSLTGSETPTTDSSAIRQPLRGDTGSVAPPVGFKNAPPCSGYYGEKTASTVPIYYGRLTWAPCGYNASQLRSAYGLAGAVKAGDDGTGQTVAIVDAYDEPTLLADAERWSKVNEPEYPLTASQFTNMGSASYNDEELCEAPGWGEEQSLDVEAVHAMAPGAHILFVGAENCEAGLYEAVHKVVAEKLASVITDSWGVNGGDLFVANAEKEAFDAVLQEAAAVGIGVQFSAGDEGSNFSDLGMNVPDYPAVSDWATAVGGTTLKVGAKGERLGETGWSTGKSFLCTKFLQEIGLPGCNSFDRNDWDPPAPGAYDYGGGGGTSFEYLEPKWQSYNDRVPVSLAERNSKITKVTNRVEPDISMDADPTTGLKIGETQLFPNGPEVEECTPSTCHEAYEEFRLGGTSLASPLLAGLMADVDQAAGTPVGFANPLLYTLYEQSASDKGAIYDVLAAGKQAVARNDYLLPEHGEFVYTTARVLGFEGRQAYCSGTEECEEQNVILHATPGFDSMTGIGSPGPEFLHFASTVKPVEPEEKG